MPPFYYDHKRFRKYCPAAYKAIFGRRYLLPAHLQSEYATQDTVHIQDMTGFMNMTLAPSKNESMRTSDAVALMLYKYNKPTIFVDRNIGEMLVRSDLPEDVQVTELRWPWPAMRLMLPRGLLKSRHGAQWLEIAKMEAGETVECTFAEEFFSGLSAMNLKPVDTGWASVTNATGVAMFFGDVATDFRASLEYAFDDITWRGPWIDQNIQALIIAANKLETYDQSLDVVYDPTLAQRARAFVLNVLLLLNQYPLREDIEVVGKGGGDGTVSHKKIFKSELLQARFLSEMVSIKVPPSRPPGEPTGVTRTAHWVRGHWHTVRFGKGWSQRRRQWFLPYRTGEQDESVAV